MAVDSVRLETKPTPVQGFTILNGPNLDPVTVLLVDWGERRGQIIVECWGEVWGASFGGIGDRSMTEFIAGVGPDYLVNKLTPPKYPKAKLRYVERIATVVIQACEARLVGEAQYEIVDAEASRG